MALRYHSGPVAVAPEIAPGDHVPDAAFERWWRGLDPQFNIGVDPKRLAEVAFLAGVASMQRVEAAPKPTPFRPVALDTVVPVAIGLGDAQVVLADDAARTIVAAVAYFTDMVLAMKMGSEDLLDEPGARALLDQLTDAR